VISERAARKKREKRQREAVAKERRLTEAATLLTAKLGSDLGRFVELFSTIAPYDLRSRLIEELDQQPDPNETVPPIDEEKIEELRRKWASRPHPVGGFKLNRVE
jgi:hypothetical protein